MDNIHFTIADVIKKIQAGIVRAQRDDAFDSALRVTQVTLELVLVATRTARAGTAGLAFIPLFKSLGSERSESSEDTQTITLTFEPIPVDAIAQATPFALAVDEQLARALVAVSEGTAQATGGEFPLGLQTVVVSLNFELSAAGEIEIVVWESGRSTVRTHTVTVHLTRED